MNLWEILEDGPVKVQWRENKLPASPMSWDGTRILIL